MTTKPAIRTGARAASPKPAATIAVKTPAKATDKGLTFTHNGHRYKLDGLPVTGVTTLIGGGVPKPALIRWAPKVVAEWVTDSDHREELDELLAGDPTVAARILKELPTKARDEAGVRGTAVHALAEQLATTGEVEAPNELAGYVEGYAKFLDDWQITAVLTERPCGNRADWYAGTFDLIATSPFLADGKPVMIDLKTSRSVYGETALQNAAYSKAEFHGLAGAEEPMPDVAATYVAHVRDGHTDLYQLAADREQIDAQYGMFLAASYTHKTTKAREAFITEPLAAPNTETEKAA